MGGGGCCVPSLLFDLRPNYGGGNEDNGDLLQKVPCMHCHTQCPQVYSRPLLTHAFTGDPWTLTDKCGSVSCEVCALFSWVLVHKVLFVPIKSLFPQSCASSGSSMVGLMVTSFERVLPYPDLLHPEPLPLRQDTADPYLRRRQSKAFLAQSLWDIWDLVCPSFILAL